MSTVLVTGATGTTGSRVATGIRERGWRPRLATRAPRAQGQVRFDWADRDTHAPALAGVRAVYLVAPIGVADPLPLVEPFLDEALRQGVRRVVQLSSSSVAEGTPGLGELHHLIRTTVPGWTVLRASWFMQNFTGQHPVAQGVRDGEIVTATGDGKVGFIDAQDIAEVAVHALTDEAPHNTEHLITGPEALSYADAAAIITELTGRPVRHRSVPTEEQAGRIAAAGVPSDFAQLLAGLDEDIRGGAEDRVTDTVERVTGRPPRSFRTVVEQELR